MGRVNKVSSVKTKDLHKKSPREPRRPLVWWLKRGQWGTVGPAGAAPWAACAAPRLRLPGNCRAKRHVRWKPYARAPRVSLARLRQLCEKERARPPSELGRRFASEIMCGCIPLPSWAGGSAEEDAPPTERQERVNRYAEELRRERGLSADEEERRLEERLAELEAKHAEALRAGDAGRLAVRVPRPPCLHARRCPARHRRDARPNAGPRGRHRRPRAKTGSRRRRLHPGAAQELHPEPGVHRCVEINQCVGCTR